MNLIYILNANSAAPIMQVLSVDETYDPSVVSEVNSISKVVEYKEQNRDLANLTGARNMV
jgi:hypothetical protein